MLSTGTRAAETATAVRAARTARRTRSGEGRGERCGEVVISRLGARLVEGGVAVVNTAAVEYIAAWSEDNGLGRDARPDAADQHVLCITCDLAWQIVFFAVAANGGGIFFGIGVDEPEFGVLWCEALV